MYVHNFTSTQKIKMFVNKNNFETLQTETVQCTKNTYINSAIYTYYYYINYLTFSHTYKSATIGLIIVLFLLLFFTLYYKFYIITPGK